MVAGLPGPTKKNQEKTMFTIKYIYPTKWEYISGPYDYVSTEWVGADGKTYDPTPPNVAPDQPCPPATPRYLVVYAFKDGQSVLTLGPNIPHPDDVNRPPLPPARAYVMNESGATIARYQF